MGTTKVCVVIGAPAPGGGVDVIGVGTAPSRGLRKGVVVNVDATVEAIRQAVAEAEGAAGVEVARVLASVSGGHLRGANSRGVVGVSGKDREVSALDVERAVEAARALNLPQDREMIHVLPQTFSVDDCEGIREPVGMSGVRLEVMAHIVTGAVTPVQNVVRSVNRAGLEVQDVVIEALASAEAVLVPEEKELGVVLIDIGGGTTDVALFVEGAVWHTASLPLGGDQITNDIAIGLRTPASEAEELKRRHGCALTSLVQADETIDVPSVGGRKPRQLSRQILSEIVQARVEELLTIVARDLARAGFQDAPTAGIVVTGGTSVLEGVPELAEAVFDLPVRRGWPEAVGGLTDAARSPGQATAAGLALLGARRRGATRPATAGPAGGRLRRLTRRIGGWFAEIF